MAATDTKGDLLRYLDHATRELSPDNVNAFTTAQIADECHISRNLASQYLNELVRDGMVVKVGARPRLFFHRSGLERYLQKPLQKSEYASIEDLLATVGSLQKHDFEKLIGCDMSLGVCIEQLKSAISYPPHGLPVLLVGDHGTGKETLAQLSYEYGVNSGVFAPDSKYMKIDCSRYEENDSAAEGDIFGTRGHAGAVQEAQGGIVYLNRFDHLSRTVCELIINRILESSSTASAQTTRYILSTARSIDNARTQAMSRMLPITVHLPRYADRDVDERTALAMHYFRVEARRAAADVSISRGVLRTLVGADFDENIDGLKSCIATCCASAYLNREDSRLIVRSYNLPLHLLGGTEAEADDDQLVNGAKPASPNLSKRIMAYFERIVELYGSYEDGQIGTDELEHALLETVHAYEDYLNFDGQTSNARISAYERVLGPILEEMNSSYSIELTRKTARMLAQGLSVQLWGGTRLAQARRKNRNTLARLISVLRQDSQMAATITDQIALRIRTALGADLDECAQVILLIEVMETLSTSTEVSDYFGVVLCHGYATATSIADAANRLLHRHVFEAIDMTYDQQITDVVAPLTRMLERYSFAQTVAMLVDMGSLSQIADEVPGISNGKLYIVNNVSTGLALEVGNALISHENLDDVLDAALPLCTPSFRVVEAPHSEEAIAFCSEAGSNAAEKLRCLIRDSLPDELPMRLVTCDYHELERLGDKAPVFSAYRVRAVVGTMNPGIEAVPFVALEDILYKGSSEALDRALRNTLGAEGIASFHKRLLRNVTLRNVVESITILNPEMLYIEADHAIQKLSELQGKPIDARCQIALYVHLCGLIERLITRNFVDTYPGDLGNFQTEHADFIDWFRQSFDDMCRRYKVEIPLSEIAYVYHMLQNVPAGQSHNVDIAGTILEDE